MPKPDKKQRQKKKREAKKLAARKLNSISPIKRLGMATGNVQCWRSANFETHGQTQIFIYKQAAGLSGLACFLVDRGVVGLKDAWFQMGITMADIEEKLAMSKQRNIAMTKTSVEDARNWIARGVRWAHDNGMRLPADWAKCASIIGGVGDWQSASVSGFAMEFAGHPEDLRRRLTREPFDDFIRRTDISFVFSDAAPYLGQSDGDFFDDEDDFEDGSEDDEYLEPLDEKLDALDVRVQAAVDRLTPRTAAWLTTRDQTASTELNYAWRVVFLATALTMPMVDIAPAELEKKRERLIDGMAGNLEGRSRSEFMLGVTQVLQHLAEESGLMESEFEFSREMQKQLQ